MKRVLCVVTALIIFLSPSLALTHGGGNHGDGHEGHDHDKHHACKYYLPKTDLPDFNASPWEIIDTFRYGFTFTFYRNAAQPEIPVAAMKVYGVDPTTGAPHTRTTWQVGEEIKTVRLEIEEMVCARSIFADDGSRRDLSGPYVSLRTRKELADVPSEIYNEFLRRGGYSLPHGTIDTVLATRLKKGGLNPFVAQITAFPVDSGLVLFFYRGPVGVAYALEKKWLVEVRWKENGKIHIWSRREITLDDGDKVILDPPLKDRPGFKPQLDSVF